MRRKHRFKGALDSYFEELKQTAGYQSRDLIVLHPEIPNLSTLLAKFDATHYHTDAEVRYIIAGDGVFSLTTLLKTMKTLLKKSALLLALPISVLASFSLRASADSTAGIILSTKCRGGYNINIWQNHTSGKLLYRATSPNGNLSLDGGTSQATEGVRVYKFRNGNYEYWVWDGTLDNPQAGTLEVYKNNRILMQQACTKN
ncbi:MAG TPA: hypothetical protein V6D14_34630 [Coleofasciculaceae cyanobacterium]|jgi:hypothetical protein